MSDSPRSSSRLREMLRGEAPVVVPCAFDCVSARVVEMAGLPAVMHGGFNTAASRLGQPDVGIITLSEMIQAAHDMARCVDIPVIADVDDGFGQALNAARAARDAIEAGIAGVYMEDQQLPKRCPSLGGGRVVEASVMCDKVHAVNLVREKQDPDFVLIARVHSSLALGLEEGITRGIQYAQAGADLVWIDLGYDEKVRDDLKLIAQEISPHAQLVANMTENVGRPMLTSQALNEMGFKLITYPLTLILADAQAMQRAMAELVQEGTTRAIASDLLPVRDFEPIVRMGDIHTFEQTLQQRTQEKTHD